MTYIIFGVKIQMQKKENSGKYLLKRYSNLLHCFELLLKKRYNSIFWQICNEGKDFFEESNQYFIGNDVDFFRICIHCECGG